MLRTNKLSRSPIKIENTVMKMAIKLSLIESFILLQNAINPEEIQRGRK